MVDPTVDDSFSGPSGSDGYDDYDDDASTETPADEGSYSLREVKDNPHLSLVKYNMTAGSPITQFFSDFDENSVDPFSAATKFSSTFFRKMQAEDEAADNLREVRAKLFIQQQADRLQSSIRSYDLEMQQATTYRLLSTTPTPTTSPTYDLYNSPTGFVPRPTHYDLYSLLASQETKSLSLRSSMYEIHNNYYVAALQQRSGSNELITQTYTSNGMLPTAGNESSMRILLGNDIAAKVLREQDRIGIGKSPTTIKTVSGQGHSFSLHAKVGYFQDDSTSQVHSAFISTQNPTHTLARAHTTEEMLVLTSKSTLDGTPRAHIRNELIENIKHVTDSIHEAFDDIKRSTPGVSVDAMRQHLSLTNPRDLVEKVTAYYKAKTPSRANQSVFVGKEIQQQIADRLQRIAGDKGGSKVVLSIQYLETLLIQNGNSTKMTASSLTSSG
jgi:hypothetical protein